MLRPAIIISCLFAAMGILACYILWQRTEACVFDILPPCLLHRYTGLHCPGCGGTRAVRALANGDLTAAIGWNPLLLIGFPLFILGVFFERRYCQRTKRLARVSQVTLFVVLLFFLLRNLPTPSTGWLAPRADFFAEQEPSAE